MTLIQNVSGILTPSDSRCDQCISCDGRFLNVPICERQSEMNFYINSWQHSSYNIYSLSSHIHYTTQWNISKLLDIFGSAMFFSFQLFVELFIFKVLHHAHNVMLLRSLKRFRSLKNSRIPQRMELKVRMNSVYSHAFVEFVVLTKHETSHIKKHHVLTNCM